MLLPNPMAVPYVLSISSSKLKPRLSSSHLSHSGYGANACKLNSISCLTASSPLHHVFLSFSKLHNLCLCHFSRTSTHFSKTIKVSAAFHRHAWKPCQAKDDVSEGAFSSEGIILDEKALERDLEMAIEEENYAQAAKIRDSLRFLHKDSKVSVLAANARFYNLFRNGDLVGMQAFWAKGDNVCCVHPGVSGISGYDLVMGSWEFVCAEYEFPLEIEVKNVEVHVRGDVGYVTCIEVVKTKGSGNWGKQFATNVFERIDGKWYICVHHASCIDL